MRKVLFLDFDGTLCDSLPAMRDAFSRFLEAVGIPTNTVPFEKFNGPPIAAIVATLRAQYGLTQPVDGLIALYSRFVDDAHMSALPAAGADDLLRQADERGRRAFIVTSAKVSNVQQWLRRHELSKHIAGVIGGDSVTHGKPHPEPYLAALALSRSEAPDALAVEDSAQGVTSALAAGVPVWMISGPADPGLISRPEFRGHIPDLRAIFGQL